MQCHKGCRLEHPLRAMSLVSWGVERLTRFSLSLYLFRVIWLNVYKVLLCLHCWGITTIRCPSMLAYGLANNNLVCILCSEDGLLYTELNLTFFRELIKYFKYFRMKFALFFRFFDSWYIIKYVLTETEGNSMFCGPETVDIP